jgi:uncharacterized membrane protein YkvA (DUF1232 family)
MSLLPDNALVLVTCIAVLAVCVFIFIAAFKIAFKIKSLKVKFAAMGFSALYALSPIDLAPDFIPILGQIDDAGAIAVLIGLALSVYTEFRKKKGKANAN